MKKYLPYAPLAIMILSTLSLQVYHSQQAGLLSSMLSTVSGEVTASLCTTPEGQSKDGESAWCQRGLVSSIVHKGNIWNWSCILADVDEKCTFEKTAHYPIRGAQLFQK